MPDSLKLEFVSVTDPGVVRQQNEDSVAIVPEVGLAVLADGMGGYNAGEVASTLTTHLLSRDLAEDLAAVYSARDRFDLHSLHGLLRDHITDVNRAVYDAAHSQEELSGMGTTLVMALFHGDCVTIAHVGDSRAYRYRRGKLEQVTRDHSLLQEQIDAGLISELEARFSMHKNLVTRAVGVDPVVEPDIIEVDTEPDDIFLLCSDGLTDMVEDVGIAALMTAYQEADARLDELATGLVRTANDHGGRDNVSVILARVDAGGERPKRLLSRMTDWLKSQG
ncbi:Stp1/IreP family PP2C-type Ser/Thr phosphatase [Derxia gummosa]|uniref:Stp1/IreP family PP2C-type Ser/Thr phosphatase n=1 Tax=Derxia gummosa DSM 723 TaxID=1121388 RepID=A0A8B6X1E3_9BURK|nr:Stp1/IreP family PP2C-type Ser/Thr phosphatase [Derxia gummosa]